jgi:hypothetical protein
MSVRHVAQSANPFLSASIGRLSFSNASNGSGHVDGRVLNVVDGIFVGHFIGSNALAAVSFAFPIATVLSAVTTLAGGGMSSLMARHLRRAPWPRGFPSSPRSIPPCQTSTACWRATGLPIFARFERLVLVSLRPQAIRREKSCQLCARQSTKTARRQSCLVQVA